MNTSFIEFLAKSGAVQFGDFALKSGRQSPFFISTGVLCDAATTYELARHYAAKIKEAYGENFDALFGPAYKGIPLAVSISIALQKEFAINKPWIFDRKEKKTYGDASSFVGARLDKKARYIVLDDVMTTGETKLEAIQKIEQGLGGEVVGIVIAVDRQERGRKLSAAEEFTDKTGVPIHAVTTIKDVFEHLHNLNLEGRVYVDDETHGRFLDYRRKYGV